MICRMLLCFLFSLYEIPGGSLSLTKFFEFLAQSFVFTFRASAFLSSFGFTFC